MTLRDWMEAAWHAGLLVLVAPPVLRGLLRYRSARLLLAVGILAALVYHVEVVAACHQAQPLCYWAGP